MVNQFHEQSTQSTADKRKANKEKREKKEGRAQKIAQRKRERTS
jgi:hypothetical protein